MIFKIFIYVKGLPNHLGWDSPFTFNSMRFTAAITSLILTAGTIPYTHRN